MSDSSRRLNARLRTFENDATITDVNKTLREALTNADNRLVGRAAKFIGERQVKGMERAMLAAYARFFEDPVKTDPGCAAKIPICEALRQLECDNADFFFAGIRYVQFEPGFGGETDTASELRAICGFALIQLNDSRAMSELVDLLGDSSKTARAGAARAIAHARGQTSELLLRLKINLGDLEPEVLGECFSGLLRLTPDTGIDRIACFLTHSNTDVCCEAALALGETRSAAAFLLLKEQADLKQARNLEHALLTSIGLLSLPESIDYLLQVIASSDAGAAGTAIRALRHCRDPHSFADRLLTTIQQVDNQQLANLCAEEFPEFHRDGN